MTPITPIIVPAAIDFRKPISAGYKYKKMLTPLKDCLMQRTIAALLFILLTVEITGQVTVHVRHKVTTPPPPASDGIAPFTSSPNTLASQDSRVDLIKEKIPLIPGMYDPNAKVSFMKPGIVPNSQGYGLTPASQAKVNETLDSPSKEASTNGEQESRRTRALDKVRDKSRTPKPKGMTPAMYSTDGMSLEAFSSSPEPGTTVTVNGQKILRKIPMGVGQEGNAQFTPVNELHFVQFAVYCQDTPVDKAPHIEGLYLLWHAGSTCPDGALGANYIVKGYSDAETAREAVTVFKAQHIDCWYNPALTGAEVEIIGVR